MRNFEERKAEIFRRSENRIIERKRKHRQLLAFCIPFCVVCIFSAAIIPSLPFATDDSAAESNIAIFDSADKSDEDLSAGELHSYVTVAIDGINKQQYTVTAASSVDGIFELFDEIFSYYDISDFSETASNTADSSTLKDAPSEDKINNSITVELNNNGSKRILTLDGNSLSDTANNIEIELSDEQLNELKTALGLAYQK